MCDITQVLLVLFTVGYMQINIRSANLQHFIVLLSEGLLSQSTVALSRQAYIHQNASVSLPIQAYIH